MKPINASRKALTRLARGLPASWYRDAKHHEKELNAFWYNNWIAVAREEELIHPGDYRVVTLGSQSIVLLRAENHALRAYHNTCRHRGSILCTEVQGHFKGQHITCPYHAWTYSLDGRLIDTPRRMPTSDFEASNFSLFPVHVDSWGGYIFINLRKIGRAHV